MANATLGVNVNLRPGVATDAEACGRTCYEAFGKLAAHHNFPSDFPSVQIAIGLMKMLLSHPGFYRNGKRDKMEKGTCPFALSVFFLCRSKSK